MTIQRAYRKYKKRKIDSDLPDLNDASVKDATVKIQSAYRGFRTRKQMKNDKDDLPDLNAADVAAAAPKIQAGYKGFKARKMIKQHKEIMPDLNCAQVKDATIKIQSAYRGFQARKTLKKQDSLPDLKARDVVEATIKIQSAYRGFKTRKVVQKKKEETDDLPDICDPETIAAALKIQSAFKGYQVRKVHSKVPLTPQPSIDFENMSPGDFSSTKTSSKRVPPVPKRSDSTRMQSPKDTSKPVPKSPLPAKSTKLKEVPIPSVPSKPSRPRMSSSSSSNFSETEKDSSPSPVTPTTKERGRQEQSKDGKRDRSRSKESQKKELSLAQKEKEEASKSKIGGFFSSMFKSKPKPKTPTTPPDSPDSKTPTTEFKQPEKKEEIKQIVKPPTPEAPQKLGKVAAAKMELPQSEESNGKPTQHTVQSEMDDPNLKKDLIHTVLNAVQENWLNQAPKPTLDKAAALQLPDSDPELENSERSTSEADYIKKKLNAQKRENIGSDDEGAQLWKQQESADGDLPYVETTLPQERPGTVTITPAAMRISQVQLTSTERPRTTGPVRPANLANYKREDKDQSKEPLTVKLPRQESKPKLKTRTPSQPQMTTGQAKPRIPPKSIPLKTDNSKPWVDCESLPEKKKTAKKYGSSGEPVKSPASDTSRSGLQTPTGTQIVSPEECSCDCHHTSPPSTLTKHKHTHKTKEATKEPIKPTKPSQPSTRAPAASAKESTKKEVASKGAVPKTSVKRPGGPPTPPIRTTSVTKATKPR